MSHHDYEGYSSGSVLLAFVLGGMVGAGVALLLAPQSGTETRKKIKDLADDVKEKATDYAGTAKEMVSSTVDKAKGLYEEKKSAITAAVEAGKDAYEKEVAK
jgi:gas vesicle protein